MAIYYSILYPPIVPLSHPAFELTKPEDTFRIYFEPSVGNKISEFSGGFIRIRNAETEKNALLPIGDGYIDGFIPFRNPFAEYVDLIDPSKNILQPEGYNPTLPFVQQNERNEYFIDLKQEAFTLSGSQKDIRYKLQIMVTRDWVSSTADNGRGNILVYKDDQVSPGYQRIDTNQYFGGNLIQKGLSEWSSNTLIAPVSIANYELQIDGNNIFSPIVEFVGSTVDDNIRNNTMANYLKAYRINIYKAFEGRKDTFVDSSDWIIGQEASNLEIRWQNKVEFENKENYIIELDIQTAWDLRKTFTYYVYTQFEASLFKGSVKVLNDHDYARSKIIMNIQTPLQWGPRDNFDISTDDRDYAVINDEAFVQEGVDFFSDRGSLAGEMLIKGIDPIRNWHENDKRWFFKLKGPEITDKNHFQEVYSMYAHCIPLGKDKESDGPYTDDIIINPVIESPTGEVYKTYVDSSRTPEPYFDKDKVSAKDTSHKIIEEKSANMTSEVFVKDLPVKNLITKSGNFGVNGYNTNSSPSWKQVILDNGNLQITVPSETAQHFKLALPNPREFKKGDTIFIQIRAKASEDITIPFGLTLNYNPLPYNNSIPIKKEMTTVIQSAIVGADCFADCLYFTSSVLSSVVGTVIEIESIVMTVGQSPTGTYMPAPEDLGVVHGQRENLLNNSRITTTITSNNETNYPISTEILTENGESFVRVKRTGIETNNSTYSVFNSINIGANLTQNISGKRVEISCMYRSSHELNMTLMAILARPTFTFPDHVKLIKSSKNWQQVSMIIDEFPTTQVDTLMRFLPNYADISGIADSFYVDYKNWKISIIEDDSNEASEWTPSQADSGLTIKNEGMVPFKNESFMTMNLRNKARGRFKFFIPEEYNKISNISFESYSKGQVIITNNGKISEPSSYQKIDIQKTDMKDNVVNIYFQGAEDLLNFETVKFSYDLTTDAPEVQPLLSDLGGVVTIRSTLPSSHTYFYLEDDNNQLWRTTITPAGEFVTDISHEKDPMEFLKPVYFWDAHTRTLVKPTVDAKGVIDLSIASENYSLEENTRPPYVNEFRFVKEIYALELGRKVKILKQTYKAYMTDFNRKLGKWHKISRDRKYYIYFSASEGQIQLVVRDLSASDLENGFDRFTLTYTGGANIGVKSDMFLTTTGVNKDFLEPKKDDGSPLPYTITSGETGILTNDLGYINASTSTSRSLRESDIEEMRNKGEIEE